MPKPRPSRYNRSTCIGTRMEPGVKDDLEKLAVADGRSLSSLISVVLKSFVTDVRANAAVADYLDQRSASPWPSPPSPVVRQAIARARDPSGFGQDQAAPQTEAA